MLSLSPSSATLVENKADGLANVEIRPDGAGPKAETDKPGIVAGTAARASESAEIFIVASF